MGRSGEDLQPIERHEASERSLHDSPERLRHPGAQESSLMEALAPTGARSAECDAPLAAKASLSLAASLRANVSWTLLGNVVYAACQWGMLVAFAKLGQAQMVGEYGLGLAITAPVFMFANLQLGSVLATDAAGASAFADYFGARATTTVAALVTSCVVAFATQGVTNTA